MTPMLLIASGIAVWRVAFMITDEEGPFSIFRSIRARFHQGTWYGRGLNCVWCISFWLGIIVGLVAMPSFWGLVYGLACSGIAIFINTIMVWALKHVE